MPLHVLKQKPSVHVLTVQDSPYNKAHLKKIYISSSVELV